MLRLEPASRNGFSLPRNDCPFPGRHSGIEVPSLLLRCFAEFSPSPFGLRLLRSFRLAPDWARSPPQARFSAEIPQSRSVPEPPLPFRVFCTPPDQRISPATNQGLASRMCPIAFRSPPPFYWNSSTADQRSRLASLPFGSLFPEPLGTKCYVHSKRCYSQMNFARAAQFSSRFSQRILLQLEDARFGLFVHKTCKTGFVVISGADPR